jgi:hypothetical protein
MIEIASCFVHQKTIRFPPLRKRGWFLKHLHINADTPYIANDTGAIIHYEPHNSKEQQRLKLFCCSLFALDFQDKSDF